MLISRFSLYKGTNDIFLTVTGPQSKRNFKPSSRMTLPSSVTKSSTNIDQRRSYRGSFLKLCFTRLQPFEFDPHKCDRDISCVLYCCFSPHFDAYASQSSV